MNRFRGLLARAVDEVSSRAEFIGVVTLALLIQEIFVRTALISPDRPYHMDEALYTYWGASAAGRNNWTIFGTFYGVDKPPLLPVLLGVSFKLFGFTKAASFMLNRLLGAIGCALVYELARVMAGRLAGIIAFILLVMSATWQFYSFSCFTDVGLVVCSLACLLFIHKEQWGLVGFMATCAVGFKQHGVYTLGFSAMYLAWNTRLAWSSPSTRAALKSYAIGLSIVAIPLLRWSNRNKNWHATWIQQGHEAVTLRLVDAWQNAIFWVDRLAVYAGITPMGLAVLSLIALLAVLTIKGSRKLVAFSCLYAIAMSLTALRHNQRYILMAFAPLVPLIGIGLARVYEVFPRNLRFTRTTSACVVVAGMAFSSLASFTDRADWMPESIKQGIEPMIQLAARLSRNGARLVIPEDCGWEFAGTYALLVKGAEDISIGIMTGKEESILPALEWGNLADRYLFVSDVSPITKKLFQNWRTKHHLSLESRFSCRFPNGATTTLWMVGPSPHGGS